jgi:glutamate synthase (NADPH/NADH) small chain
MEKSHIDRRIEQMGLEGIVFHNNCTVGKDIQMNQLISDYNAVILSGGAEKPRNLPIEGRELEGVHFAMNFLPQQNRRIGNESLENVEPILATNKHVIVIGGGDTGSDCIGTSIRQGALSVTQLEIMPTPPDKENKLSTWPNWPLKLRTSSSQEEGANREFSVLTQQFEGSGGHVKSLKCIRVNQKFEPINNSEFNLKADLVLLALGFVSPVIDNLSLDLDIKRDTRNNIQANDKTYKTSHDKVWVAGDMRRGQSLVVWAIREGRQCAHAVDKALMGQTALPR